MFFISLLTQGVGQNFIEVYKQFSANIEVFWTFTGEIFDKQFSFPQMYLNFDASPKLRGGGTRHIHKRGGKSDIFGSECCQK